MRKPRALDLFCKAGGATKGLQRAGFHVTGVDIEPQRHYCGDEFIQAHALEVPLDGYDFIWASPPCQAHCDLRSMYNAKRHIDLIPQTRERLQSAGVPYVIENVEGAPLINPTMLCGSMFKLTTEDAELRRHRLFEMNFAMLAPNCRHGLKPRVIGVYGGHGRDRRRKYNAQDFSTDARREAMGIDWMNGAELSQAIPPAYAEFIGQQVLRERHGEKTSEIQDKDYEVEQGIASQP